MPTSWPGKVEPKDPPAPLAEKGAQGFERSPNAPPDRHTRLLLGLVIGLLSAVLCFLQLTARGCLACDFHVSWWAGRLLLEGQDPYAIIQPRGEFPFHTTFYYPLMAALGAIPFAGLPPSLAGAVFFGLGAGLLAYAVTGDGWQRLPLFLSAPFFVAAAVAQWSPWLAVAALLPPLQWLALCKPNIGLGALAYNPTKTGFVTSLLFLGLSFLVLPGWLSGWQAALSGDIPHKPPFLIFPAAALLLLAALRWWDPNSRMLLALSLAPQTIWFYDQLLFWLAPRSLKSSLALTGLSWIAYGVWRFGAASLPMEDLAARPDAYVVALLFLPNLGLVFWQGRLTPKPASLKGFLHDWWTHSH